MVKGWWGGYTPLERSIWRRGNGENKGERIGKKDFGKTSENL
jgi:hypothetical protein